MQLVRYGKIQSDLTNIREKGKQSKELGVNQKKKLKKSISDINIIVPGKPRNMRRFSKLT